tara:strand:- start:425 stop:694 length:270 start_codon:yes stop_codon:yes gene_type:complete
MKTFKQFLEEAYNKVINLKDAGWGRPHKFYKKDGETRYGPTGDRLFRLQAKGDVKKKDYDKLQQKYKDEYFNSPQINPPILDPLKKIKA